MKNWFIYLFCSFAFISKANASDTLRFQLHGCIDGYSVFGKSNELGKIPYLVSSSNLNSFQINLNLMEFTWKNSKWKYALSPAMGSYMRQNYANESWYKRWIYEAYVQRKFQQSAIAMGVFSSPYTQETPKSIDQLSYSRSLAPEYVPYYISGFRYQLMINSNLNVSFFAMNGWQKMNYRHFSPSIGSLLEFKRNQWKFNWSTYFGTENNATFKEPQQRFLSEWNVQYTHQKWLSQICAYVGTQGINFSRTWGQINAQVSYSITNNWRSYGRLEFFKDPSNLQIPTGQLSSESIGIIHALNETMNIGTEFRCFQSEKKPVEPYQFLFFQLKF